MVFEIWHWIAQKCELVSWDLSHQAWKCMFEWWMRVDLGVLKSIGTARFSSTPNFWAHIHVLPWLFVDGLTLSLLLHLHWQLHLHTWPSFSEVCIHCELGMHFPISFWVMIKNKHYKDQECKEREGLRESAEVGWSFTSFYFLWIFTSLLTEANSPFFVWLCIFLSAK